MGMLDGGLGILLLYKQTIFVLNKAISSSTSFLETVFTGGGGIMLAFTIVSDCGNGGSLTVWFGGGGATGSFVGN